MTQRYKVLKNSTIGGKNVAKGSVIDMPDSKTVAWLIDVGALQLIAADGEQVTHNFVSSNPATSPSARAAGEMIHRVSAPCGSCGK